ncbi:MAG: hypothetical protein EB101_12860 [Chitinophagia bacterium]|nr:hypothetical protein [Chitinophagia bacterium]
MRIIIALLFLATTTLHAQVGIGTATPNSAAALDINSTSKGLLMPRLTTAQRDAISPVAGLVIYNTSVEKFQGYAGTGSSTTLAQSTEGSTFTYIKSDDYPAQTFQVPQATSNFDISIWSYYVNNGLSASSSVTIELYQGVPGSSSTILTSQVFQIYNLSEKRTLSFTGVSLYSGTTYYFLVKPTNSITSPAPALARSGTGNGAYASGTLYRYSSMSGGSWSVSGDDLRFEIVGGGAGWVNLH